MIMEESERFDSFADMRLEPFKVLIDFFDGYDETPHAGERIGERVRLEESQEILKSLLS